MEEGDVITMQDIFTFNGNDRFEYDREDAPWAADEAALDALWKQTVRNDWLRLKLAGKDDKAIRDTLDKRYENYLSRSRKLNSEDVFQIFMNAYAMSIEPHTNYLGPRAAENFDIAMRLSLEGIGCVLQSRDDYTVVREVVPGSPAGMSTGSGPACDVAPVSCAAAPAASRACLAAAAASGS